jgi:hypothetical protein
MMSAESQLIIVNPNLYGCRYHYAITGCYPNTWGCGGFSLPQNEGSSGTAGTNITLYNRGGFIYTAPTIPESPCGTEVIVGFKISVSPTDGNKGGVGTCGYADGQSGSGDGESCYKEFSVSVKNNDCVTDYCQPNPSIAYSSFTVNFGMSQTFTIYGKHPGATESMFSWQLSGEGSLSATSGFETTYTAPDDNANCGFSATINLYCNGTLMDSIELSISIYDNDSLAFRVYSSDNVHCAAHFRCECTRSCYAIYCSGRMTTNDCNGSLSGFQDCYSPPSGCTDRTCSPQYVDNVDVRTEEMKQNGCCPANQY